MMATRGWEKATPNDVRHRRPLTTMTQVKRSKYNAVKTTVDGITFHSAKEARRYAELKLLEKAGELHNLNLQPEWYLHAKGGRRIGIYIADFQYCVCAGGSANCGWCKVVIEDVKGFKTPLYRWKKKHVEAQYGIQIREL